MTRSPEPPRGDGPSIAERPFRSTPLAPGRHRLDLLDSGEPLLDGWLREHAVGAEARRVARTFVWSDPGGEVRAYYSLASHRIARDELPRALARGGPSETPAFLLARLALDRQLHGHGLGGELLVDALERVVEASQIVGARIVVVDALNEAAARFYVHHGFRRVPGTLRLVQKLSSIEQAIVRGTTSG